MVDVVIPSEQSYYVGLILSDGNVYTFQDDETIDDICFER